LLADRDHPDIKFNFADKKVLMTGASSGIGASIAKKFIASGATVVMMGRNIEKLNQIAAEAKRGRGIVKEIDLSHPTNLA
jgi:meso-butanediol dehydrogenase/(S,S)-butanediol dehydrogenase/diacetyl reductase